MSSNPLTARQSKRVLITGGAGFIGTNLAARLIDQGDEVIVLDSLARPGSDANAQWLASTFGERFELIDGDIRDQAALARALQGVDHVVHLAAQVAVTTSLTGPLADFDVNARGTLLLLEAIRTSERQPSLVFTSTNKVYGALDDIPLKPIGTRYLPADARIRAQGVGEARALDFHSPYGCSKGAADQYVLDYARSFGLRTVVLRMSCIYGPHQNGNEDQGWVAHFVRHALGDRAVTIFGDGRQVRDVLFVDDLLNAFELAYQHIDQISGRAFNIGGGVDNTLSLLELIEQLEGLAGRELDVAFSDWRVGDQRYYVSDTSKFSAATGWRARVAPEQGLATLSDWMSQSMAPKRMPLAASSSLTTGAHL
jgi:CDP-paratose 2-epimerase